MNEFRVKSGGRIDRSKTIEFSFNGKTLRGYQGDSLASALLANGVHFVGRSYKYHRPRGIMSAGVEEACALVGVHRDGGRFDPNCRATTIDLTAGINATSQHCWPSLKWDVGELTRLAGPVVSAGFYYKTFLWPKSFWKAIYEPIIRTSAGLGQAPKNPDPDKYASTFAHCETLVVGGGPAGIIAALSASANGKQVILCDEKSEFGGDILSSPEAEINNQSSWDWLKQNLQTLRGRKNVTLLSRTTAFGYYEQNLVGLVQRLSDHIGAPSKELPREKLIKIRAQKVILATGAIERPLVFPGNDRPGIMLAGAAKTYLARYGVKVGKQVALLTSHDSAYQTIFSLVEAGVKIATVIDLRNALNPLLLKKAKSLGIDLLLAHTIVKTSGRFRLKSIDVKPQSGDGKTKTISCDTLLVSGGWTPSVHLFSQSRGKLKWHEDIGASVPGEHFQNMACVGACNGVISLSSAINQTDDKNQISVSDEFCEGENFSEIAPKNKATPSDLSFVDLQHDVASKDIGLAIREGFHSIEHIKRYTTTGMATDQGKTSNINGLSIASKSLNKPMSEIGLTTFRPPYTPTTFGALAGNSQGALFDLVRRSPTDEWARKRGAIFEPVGLWTRASYFPENDETMDQAISRECVATRKSIGISDASTLGKIEVVGPDAGEFLNRFYATALLKLPVGRCRYALALREDGFVYDDGVVARLDENRFHVTTTTGGAGRVFTNMEDYRQTEWPELKVWLTSITEQWAVIALNGPNVRALLQPLISGIDLSADALPHMSIRAGTIFGVPLRLFRVSFTGELGFEVNVPAGFGLKVWEKLVQAGAKYNITPYGMQSLLHMRAEKGYIIVGQDSDGTQTPADLGMKWAIGKRKNDFVGMRSLRRPDMLAKNRPQLVGLLTEDPNMVLEEGAQISWENSNIPPVKMIGHVTSSYWSEAAGRSIALGLVEGGASKFGEQAFVPMPNKAYPIKLVKPVFYDQNGERLNG